MTPSPGFRSSSLRPFPLAGAAIAASVLLGACDPETSPSEPEDTIAFRSVTWTGQLRGGDTVEFRAVLDWDLRSKDSGEIDLGFNDLEQASLYRLVDSSTFVVARGAGSREIALRTVVKDWGAASDYRIHAILSEHPHGLAWSPLAETQRVLIPKK
jgi:hypothetical protein